MSTVVLGLSKVRSGRSCQGGPCFYNKHLLDSFRGLRSGINLRNASERFPPINLASLSIDFTTDFGARNITTCSFVSLRLFFISNTSIKRFTLQGQL